jgi:hypothetical protein
MNFKYIDVMISVVKRVEYLRLCEIFTIGIQLSQ